MELKGLGFQLYVNFNSYPLILTKTIISTIIGNQVPGLEVDPLKWFVLFVQEMNGPEQTLFWHWALSEDSVELYRRLGANLQRSLDANHLFLTLNVLVTLAMNPHSPSNHKTPENPQNGLQSIYRKFIS